MTTAVATPPAAGADRGLPPLGTRRAIAAVLGIAVVQLLLAALFSWPGARSAPHDVPLAVAGPPAAAQGLTAGLSRAMPGAFAIRSVPDEAGARAAVRDRSVYGAVVLGPAGSTVLVASAAAPAVAQALGEALPAALHAAAPQAPVTVQDLAPNPAHDPHGTVPATIMIPVVITSVVAGILLTLLVGAVWVRAVAVLVLAVAAGLGTTAVGQFVLEGITGSYLANAGVVALAVLAISAATAGAGAVLRLPGAGLTAVIIFFVGYPFSGALNAPELLPTPWGAVGQALPPGAAARAVRSVAFFDGSGADRPLLVLAAWALAGLLLLGLGILAGRRRSNG